DTPNPVKAPVRPAHPSSPTDFADPLGVVQFQGVEYPGKHEPLVDEETWQAVQAVLGSHRSGERERMHNHFLKSTVVCGQCGSRLLVQNTKNGKGVLYPYFICARRQRLHDCSFKAVLIEVVEAQMQEVYRRLHVSEADRQEIERYLLAELARIEGEKDRNVRSLTVRRTNLEDERRRLLQAHYGGAVPLELLKEEQERLRRELAGIQRQLDAYQADAKLVRAHVEQALDLLEDCYRLYMAAPDHLRKQLNQVFFERVLVNPVVDEDGRVILPGDGGDGHGGLQDEDDDGVKGAGDEPDGQRGCDEQEIAVGRRQLSGGSQADDAGDEPTRRADEAPCSVRVADTSSDVWLEARLNRPFDQLASARLRAVARIAALRKTPTSTGGGRRSSAETATEAVSQGEGLYSDAVVPPAGLEPARP
ncbi:recombinase zinc beta ribbon domain-containing protein, partial [Actinomyces viscosus]|uniref:recombinase zinc beta ribbon domain-containing protein n=2 Tax=Actinomyces viscosus TaxID=1656 RepID=UPI001ADCEFE7